MIIALIILVILLIVALTISVSANLRFGNMLMNIEDNTQACVDMIDKRYYNLMHVFDDSPGVINDDPLVRSFVNEVNEARNDMLRIANIISNSTEQLNENDREE
jgi:hypothetical protein